ncbi:MAG: hypothetical protein IPJ21_08230 [Sterolibacteriaceae bacterium]|nr:hypothetical protein [Sterolibacteriaceae bacterium]MBK9083853.1 hypothetical protein [Sterolibacteriaceae bacterium]
MRIGYAEPAGTDERDQNLALSEALLEDLREFVTRIDAFAVEEDACRAELTLEPVEKAPRRLAGVITTIADEDQSQLALPSV